MKVRERITDRAVHITTEDDRNIVSLHRRTEGIAKLCSGEWNDDFHHATHVIATHEADGYYEDFIAAPVAKLARSLAEGYVYQGEPSPYRDGARRGEPSAELPPTAFVDCLQNHDQVGNRALGERLSCLAAPPAIEALTAVLLLSPSIPLLFMGEEWGETHPFYFFTDFHGELARQVRDGRRNEFRRWRSFGDPQNRERIPDPNAWETFEASRIDWSEAEKSPHRERLALVQRLLAIRAREVVPLLARMEGHSGRILADGPSGLAVAWQHGDGGRLALYACLGDKYWQLPPELANASNASRTIYRSADDLDLSRNATLAPWSVVVRLEGLQ